MGTIFRHILLCFRVLRWSLHLSFPTICIVPQSYKKIRKSAPSLPSELPPLSNTDEVLGIFICPTSVFFVLIQTNISCPGTVVIRLSLLPWSSLLWCDDISAWPNNWQHWLKPLKQPGTCKCITSWAVPKFSSRNSSPKRVDVIVYNMFMVIKEEVTHCDCVCIDVFLIIYGQQWSSVTQRNNQAFDKQTVLGRRMNSLLA